MADADPLPHVRDRVDTSFTEPGADAWTAEAVWFAVGCFFPLAMWALHGTYRCPEDDGSGGPTPWPVLAVHALLLGHLAYLPAGFLLLRRSGAAAILKAVAVAMALLYVSVWSWANAILGITGGWP